MCRMSLRGQKMAKFKFITTKMCGLVIRAVMEKQREATELEVEQAIGNFLKHVPFRSGSGRKN